MPRKRTPLDHLLQTARDPADKSLPYADSSREDRSSERHGVAFDAVLRSGRGAVAVRVHELSQSGLTFDGAHGLRTGQRCLIDMPGTCPRAIDIIWQGRQRVGACFADLLPRAVLEELRARFAEPHF